MSHSASRWTVLFAVIAFTLAGTAQQHKVLAPHKAIPPLVKERIKNLNPPMARSMVGGLWMTDATVKSTIYLRNNVETDSITVTPILHLSNGKQYTLAQVKVEAAGNATIDVGDSLAKSGISSWATLSGYVELQYDWAWDPFCATVRVVDTVHSLIFTYNLRPALPPAVLKNTDLKPATVADAVEGMWWKHEKNVTAFVSVANLAGSAANASLQTTDNDGNVLAQHDVTVTPHGMKLINLDELLATSATQGGIRITSNGPTNNLVINGGLQDRAVGYSTIIPFSGVELRHDPKPADGVIAELGIMTGAADPMMNFPAGTTFTPYSVIRNVSNAPVTVAPSLWWMEGGQAKGAELPKVTVAAHQTVRMDVPSLLAQFGPSNFSGSFNLVFDGDFVPDALLLSAGAVDQTNTYVFEVSPKGVAESGSKSLQYWSTANGDDSMVTIWNPADEAQDYLFTLFFAGGKYKLPLHLEPRATRSFNVSELIHSQVPDADGNIIPPSIQEGGADISGVNAEAEHISVAVDSGVYNVRKATCGMTCGYCHGYSAAALVDASFPLEVQATKQENFILTYGTGSQYNYNSGSTWSSNATSVATVSTGLVSGVSAGTATVSTFTSSNQPVEVGYICMSDAGLFCPQTHFTGSSTGTVQVPDHLIVLHDTQGTISCGSNPSTILRTIEYEVVDAGGSQILSPFLQVRENVPPTTSSCNGSTVQTGATCFNVVNATPNVKGEFDDNFSPGCPNSPTNSPCGYTFTNQQWQYCAPSGSRPSLGTIGPVNAQNTSISVNGNILGYTLGTTFPK